MRYLGKFLAILFAAAVISTGAEAKRVALIIGNDKYQHLEVLQKAVADARTYADILKGQGFDEVMLKTDLTRAETDEAFAAFLDLIEPGDTAVFAYSGHGWSDGTQNYLVAVDAPAGGRQEFLARISIPLRNGANGILDDIDRRGAALKVAIIDACRDNPFAAPAGTKGVGVSRGLTRIEPPSGTFVIFSAGTNQQALDRLAAGDPDPNSVFTRVFAPLLKSGMPLQEATKTAQEQVVTLARTVKHDQRPAYYDEVLGKACLAGACAAPAVADKPATPLDDAAAAYQATLAINTLQAWDAFLKYHPEGLYADLARAALQKLGGEAIVSLEKRPNPAEIETGSPSNPAAKQKVASLPPGSGSAASAALVTECDRLSALILDSEKPAGLRGMARSGQVKEGAVAACRQAVADHPGVPRFKTYLAFALYAADVSNKETVPLFKEAAEAGHSAAMFGLAMVLGRGSAADGAESVRWMEKAVEAGSLLGLVASAYAYIDGQDGFPKDEAKAHRAIERAVPLLEQAVAGGDPDAPAVLVQIYLDGKLVPVDAAKAAPMFLEGIKRRSSFVIDTLRLWDKLPEATRLAAEKLLADAGYAPGPVDGVIDDQTRAALKTWAVADAPEKLASLSPPSMDKPVAAVELVTECDRLGAIILDPDKPAGLRGVDGPRWVTKETVAACRQAVADHPDILRFKAYLAFSLLAGDTSAEAFSLFREAAEAGQASAMFGLAMAYFDGRGVEKDVAEGRRWLEKSVATGSPLASVAMAFLYADGHGGVDKDEAKAREAAERALPLLEKARSAGDPDAPAILGALYIEGTILPADAAKADQFILEGLQRQSVMAADAALRQFADKLPPDTRLAAEKMLADAGFSPGVVDGVVDEQSKSALDAWAKAGDRRSALASPVPKIASVVPSDADATAKSAAEVGPEEAEFRVEPRAGETGGAVSRGSVTWRFVPDDADGPAIEAKVEIPERGLSLALSMRRNMDAKLPASHIITVNTDPSGELLGGSIDDVPAVDMRDAGDAASEPIKGMHAKIVDGYFWIALSGADSERNLTLLRSKELLDLPLHDKEGLRAVLTLHKGTSGQAAIEQAIAAWAAVAKN